MSEAKEPARRRRSDGTGSRGARGFRAFCDRHRLGFRPMVTILVLLLLVIGLLAMLLFGNGGLAKYTSRTLEFGLRDIGEFATQAGYYTNVNTIKKPDRTIAGVPIPGTSSRAIMTYSGTIRAGLDFSQIEISVDTIKKTVTLKMPAPRILTNEIDLESCEIYDEFSNIFNQIDIRNYNQSLGEMKTKAEAQARENGILEAAKSNAEVLITSMVKNAGGMEDYRLEFQWAEEKENEG